jgi:hypothetical protein
MEAERQTSDWYRTYHDRHGASRHDPLADPGVLWQIVAHDAAVARVLQRAGAMPQAACWTSAAGRVPGCWPCYASDSRPTR